MVACWEIGKRPAFCAETATPAGVCTCRTQTTSCRAAWIALWMTKPAGFTGYVARGELLAVRVDLHQAARGDLLEEHPVGVDEEVRRARPAAAPRCA